MIDAPTVNETSYIHPSTNYTGRDCELRPGHDLIAYVRVYAREKPEAFALWCFGVGFVLGWKLKPW